MKRMFNIFKRKREPEKCCLDCFGSATEILSGGIDILKRNAEKDITKKQLEDIFLSFFEKHINKLKEKTNGGFSSVD